MLNIAVVTLNWNKPADTLEFLASASRQTLAGSRLVVVDNGSKDDSVKQISAHFPQADLLVNKTNLGFARGMNTGIRHALDQGADYLFISNNDTFLAPDMLERLIDQAHQTRASIIAPVIFYASHPQQIWSAGAGRNPLTLEVIDTWRDQPGSCLGSTLFPVEFITACGMLVERDCFQSVGLFDERFFMYYEDSDFSLRVRQAGRQILVDPLAHMWHKVATSSGGSNSPGERYWMARSSMIFFRKHARPGQWLVIGPYRLGSALKTTLRLLSQGKREALRGYWRGLSDGWKY